MALCAALAMGWGPAGADRGADLAPVFGFGEAGVGLGLGREAKAAKATERISAWRAWLAKARAEGTMPGGSGGA